MMNYNHEIAEVLVRVFAGILFLLQGYDKIFRVTMHSVIDAFTADAERYHVPRPVLYGISYYTSIVELVGGLMLITGLYTNFALYALGLDLVLVCFAFTYMQPMWNMKYVFPRLALVITLLLMPAEYRTFSIDYYLVH
jgi:uncharacterized membrane protein YphA (DoxX/SURF4 family)